MQITKEMKVIGLAILVLGGLAAYQGATGGIIGGRSELDAARARDTCLNTVKRLQAIHYGAPLEVSESVGFHKTVLEGCRANKDLTNEEIGDLLGS
jgi:hypothetical protein